MSIGIQRADELWFELSMLATRSLEQKWHRLELFQKRNSAISSQPVRSWSNSRDEGHSDGELRTLSGIAFYRNAAAHQLAKPLADGESQSSASELGSCR